MASNALALCWKDHHNVLISVFEKLLEKESLVDCTLAAEGKFLKAHKIVLSACSPYLETLLNQENDKHPIIFLRDVEFKDLKTVVEFVYTGVISIPEDHLEEFLNLAEALQIKGLGSVGNKIVEEKGHDAIPEKRDATLPVPKKQLSKCSKLFDTSDKTKTSDPPDENNSLSEKIVDKHKKENKVKMVKVSDITSSSHKRDAVGEKVNEEIPEVKQEVIDLEFPGTDSVSVEQLTSLAVSCENNEELSIVKPEFEQVTFTEEYSDEMMLEENDTVESVIQPVLDQPGTSHQYSEFPPSDPLYADGVEAQGPFIVSNSSKQGSEEFSSEPFDSNRLVSQSQSMLGDPDQLPAAGLNFHEVQRSPSEGNANYELADCSISNMARDKGHIEYEPASLVDCPLGRNYSCLYCSEIFENDSELSVHMSTHSGENLFLYNFCSASSNRLGNVDRHVSSHLKKMAFQCSYCSLRFYNERILKAHLGTHTGEKNFQCTFCPASFVDAVKLKIHLRTHREQKSYQCTYCSKIFLHSSGLRRHLYIHTGQKPLQCEICFARFNDSGNFKRHLRIHNVEKPFKCSYCTKCFTTENNLVSHLQSHKENDLKNV